MPLVPTLPGPPPAAAPVARADAAGLELGPGDLSARLTDSTSGFVLGLVGGAPRLSLRPGDYVEIAQDVDLTDQEVVTVTATVTGQETPDGVRLPGYGVEADTLLCYQMDEVAAGAREETDAARDLRVATGTPPACTVPTYNGGDGLQRTWGAGAGPLVGAAAVGAPVIPAAGLPVWSLNWWQNFDVDAILTSTGVSPVVFEHRSVTAGGIRVRWLGTAGPGAHSWRLQIEHWNGGAYSAQSLVGTLRAANLGDEFFTLHYDATVGGVAVYCNGALVGVTAALAHAPGAPLDGARIQIGDALYRGSLDAVRLSDGAADLARHQEDYATRLDPPVSYPVRWRAQVCIDGDVYAASGVPADAEERPVSLSAPVALLTGVHAVACRLALEEAL